MKEICIPILYWWCMYIINLYAFLLIGILLGKKFKENKKIK
jgi:hypothetical protein